LTLIGEYPIGRHSCTSRAGEVARCLGTICDHALECTVRWKVLAVSMSITVVATGFGGPEKLKLVEENVAEPGPGQVLLEVRAAGVNPIDVKIYGGSYGREPSNLPMRLGYEAAGMVLAVGPDAEGPTGPVRVGDEVIAFRINGGYSQRVLVPTSTVVPKPAGLGWAPAGGLMLAGATAVHALAVTRVAKGETVLLHGAAGGVGLMAVQLAVSRGVRVIGTASAGGHDLLQELGAEPVTYGPGLADRVRALAPAGVDAAIDTVGTDEAVDVSLELVGGPERVVTIAAHQYGGQRGLTRIGGSPGADPGTELRNAARLELVQAVADGTLRVVVAGTYPLAEVADVHRAIMGRHRPGKLILLP
jgi:NADPH:quinone reductase